VILEDSQLALAWDPDVFPVSNNGESRYYFQRGFDFTREEVLNHLIEGRLCLHHRAFSVDHLNGGVKNSVAAAPIEANGQAESLSIMATMT
jgi:hypothetical protein